MAASAGAGDVQQMALGIVDLRQVALVRDRLGARREWQDLAPSPAITTPRDKGRMPAKSWWRQGYSCGELTIRRSKKLSL